MNFDAQTNYWDSVAAEKDFSTPINAELFKKFIPADAKIIDIGCGYGRTLCDLAGLGYDSANLVGYDISPAMIRRGQSENPSLKLDVMHQGQIPLPNDAVDAAVLLAVLTCIVSDDAQRELISEIHRILRPGGVIYISDFPLQPFERCTARYQKFADKYNCYGVFELPTGGVLRHMSMDFLHSLVEDFETLDQRNIEIKSMNGNDIIAWQYFGKK